MKKVIEKDPKLVETGLRFIEQGKILPDTYLIDVDIFLKNAKEMLEEASSQGIDLYFMLKQVGRNPYLAKKLVELGYRGAVAVDFREAQILMENGIPICNVGHLVQVPKGVLRQIVSYGPDFITVFSLEKIREINNEAKKLNKVQPLLLKVIGPEDLIYSGQTAGFHLEELPQVIQEIKSLDHIKVGGITSFPCFLIDEEEEGSPKPMKNLQTLLNARKILEEEGITNINVNAPSATCISTLKEMKNYPEITSAEPGHGLTGTTPLHAQSDEPEIPCVIYMSEVSHNYNGHAYCYGGGHYRRSHIKRALVGISLQEGTICKVTPPDLPCIDYYFELDREFPVSTPVCMAFRFQVFVTRSHVVLVEGIQSGEPKIVGEYDSQGRRI